MKPTNIVDHHLTQVRPVLDHLASESQRLYRWGVTLAHRIGEGHRLLAAGNGGSAAEAQHLTAELVGRFDSERQPFSAIALHADTSAVTAIGNDYGYEEVFARQVQAHGRSGDVLVLLSTSGSSSNLLRAASVGQDKGLTVWAFTGKCPNPLYSMVDDCLCLPGPAANVQEAHLIAIHAICRAFDETVHRAKSAGTTLGRSS
ncbi:MAG TPA: SIS domain-containing protein [Beutenbergiaceae bacterium]|nr:SIS domain-containing protein [Beutenbergiaceae bacterium]